MLKRTIVVFFLLLLAVGIACRDGGVASVYVDVEPLVLHANGQGFVGSESCRECHAELFASHRITAHFKTSSRADSVRVKGSFGKASNTYHLNDSLGFRMTKNGNGLYQEAFLRANNQTIARDTMGMVIGSGTKGQTYLRWQKEALYQLQVSYNTAADQWTNSPGMSFRNLVDSRPVNSSCLECHVTFAKSTSLYGMGNTFEKDKIIYGVDCERCHGPSEAHVNFHRKNPEIETGHAITVYNELDQQQRLDACALCHSGLRTALKPAFLFVAGDSLSTFSTIDDKLENAPGTLDVHGNQYGLLKASKCFQKSEAMNCTTCHDPHQNQRGNSMVFNQKCMQCHSRETTVANCSVEKVQGQGVYTDCIKCHMPLIDSKSMRITTEGDSIGAAVKVRTHLIKSYDAGK